MLWIGAFLVVSVAISILLPVFASARIAETNARCMNNVKSLALGALLYSADHNDHLPLAARWMETLQPLVNLDQQEEVLHCPKLPSGEYGYAYNANLAGMSTEKIDDPATTPMVFETWMKTRNAVGGQEAFLTTPRHGGSSVAYADGHTKLTRAWQAQAPSDSLPSTSKQ